MESIKLDLIPGKKMPSLHASQYDDGREHGIDLFENGVVYKLDGTETLTINERKGDDCICSLDIENTFTGSNHIVFASTEQMCAVWGNNVCELVIAKGEKTIGTLNFILEVEPDPTENGIESESEIKNLKRQIEEITEEVIGDNYYTKTQTDEAIATAAEDITNKIASEYDEEETYYRGDIVLYNGVLYECDNTDASGEFNPSDWKEITLGEGIEDVRDLLADYYTKSQSDYRFLGKTNPTGSGYFGLNRSGSAGANSVSVGWHNVANAQSSFAEGEGNTSSGYASHSEGYGNTASGLMAHAEGVTTESSGYGSHSEGVGTIANHIGQHVIGTYNVADPSTAQPTAKGNYIEIVGNGTDDNRRRNARTLDWSGNETLMGDLTYNGNKSLTSEISRLDGKIDNLPAPMIFKGTLGVGGTIQSLPTASASNEGFTYKVITDGTYAGQTAKVGDVFTSNGSSWVYIPSGDEDNDTWRAIKVNGVEKLGNGISSGAVDFEDTANVKFEFDANGNKIKATLDGIYTKAQVDDIVYGILPDDTASGSVANFTTSLELPIKSLEVDVNAVQNAGTPTPASPLPISGWSKITLVNCGNKYKPSIKPFSEWERARSDYYISRFSVPNTIIAVNLIDKDTTVDLTGVAFGFVDSYWNKANPITTNEYRWFIQNGTPQTTKKNIAIADASKILTGLIFSPQNEATYNKLMARYDYEFVFSETSNVEPYNTEVINLGNTYFGGKFTQGKNGNRELTVDMEKDTMSSSYLSGLSSSYIGYVASVPAMNNHPCVWVRNWKYPPVAKGRVAGGIKALCNAFKITMNNNDIISTQHRVYFDVDGMGITDVAEFISAIEAMEQNGNNLEICYEVENPVVVDLPDGQPIITINGTNNIYADTGDSTAVFKCSVNDYINAHSGVGLRSLGNSNENLSKGGSEEEPEEPDEPISKK